MKQYKVYTAKLDPTYRHDLIFSCQANDLDAVKDICRNRNRNPFYTVITENNEVVYNEHLKFYRPSN